jgi:YesN/AraC family two-component response regulator
LTLSEKQDGTIHLLLTDLMMPGMSGGSLAMHLTRNRSQTKVLLMSGYPEDAPARQGIHTGTAHFLQKPFSLSGLIQKVREVLDGK